MVIPTIANTQEVIEIRKKRIKDKRIKSQDHFVFSTEAEKPRDRGYEGGHANTR